MIMQKNQKTLSVPTIIYFIVFFSKMLTIKYYHYWMRHIKHKKELEVAPLYGEPWNKLRPSLKCPHLLNNYKLIFKEFRTMTEVWVCNILIGMNVNHYLISPLSLYISFN